MLSKRVIKLNKLIKKWNVIAEHDCKQLGKNLMCISKFLISISFDLMY